MAGNLDLSVKLRFIEQGFQANIDKIKSSLSGLKNQFKQADSGFTKSISDTQSLNTELGKTKDLISKAFKTSLSLYAIKEALTLSDTYKEINARLRIVSSSNNDYVASQRNVISISKETGTNLKENAFLYSKLRTNANLAAGDATKLTSIIAKASQLDGGGDSARLGIIQLQQALSSGKLAGDELRSLREQNSTLVEEIRKGMGITRQQFSQMAKDGGFAADDVIKAMLKMESDVNGKFKELPITTARAFENLKTSAIETIGKIDQSLGVSNAFANLVNGIAANLNTIVGASLVAVGVITSNWLIGIATKRAAEKAAHLARMREIAVEQAAELARLKSPAAQTILGATGKRTIAPKLDTAAIAEAEKALASTTATIATAESRFAGLGVLVEKLGSLFRFIVNPITITIGILGALLKYVTDLINTDAELSSSLGGTVTMWETFGAAMSLAGDFLKDIYNIVSSFVQNILEYFNPAIETISDIFRQVFGDSTEFAKNFVNGILNFLPAVGTALIALGKFVYNRFKSLFSDLQGLFIALGKDITNAIFNRDFSFANLQKQFKTTFSNAKNDVAELHDGLKSAADVWSYNTLGAGVDALGKKIIENRAKLRAKANADNVGGDTSSQKGKEDKSGGKLPVGVKAAMDETILLQAELNKRKADLERQYAEDIILAGDNVNKKLSLAQAYFENLNKLAIEQSAIDKKELEAQLKSKEDQQRKLLAFAPKNKGQAESKQNELANLSVEIQNINAKIQAENIKLETTLADNRSKAKQVALELEQQQKTALKDIQDEIVDLNKEAEALGLSEEAYKEYLLQKTLATELSKLEKAGIDATTEAYKEQAKALEDALRNKALSEDAKKAREEQKKIEDDMFKNVQQGIQKVFAQGLKSLGQGSLREIASNIATSIKDAVAEKLAGSLANVFIEAIGGKDSIINIGNILNPDANKKGDTVLNPLYIKDVDAASPEAQIDPQAAFNDKADGLFGYVKNLFSGVGDIVTGLFSKIGSFISSIFSSGGGGGGSGIGGLFSAIGSLFGFADGGYTGDGGTYEPKGVVHGGEFVFTKAATSRAGVGFLSGLHNVLSGGFLPTAPRLSYADGGVVDIPLAGNQSNQPQQTTRIVNVIDPKMAGEYLNSPAGEKTILNVIRRNKSGIKNELY